MKCSVKGWQRAAQVMVAGASLTPGLLATGRGGSLDDYHDNGMEQTLPSRPGDRRLDVGKAGR
jgi:hypothetical protein